MYKLILVNVACLLALLTVHPPALCAIGFESTLPSQERPPTIQINNRPLLSVHGKVITLLDVVKDMDERIRQSQPEILSSSVARFQFYNMHWREALDLLLQNTLILKDAEDSKLLINDAQVYEEMEEKFGPNIVQSLHERQLTYEEAREKTRENIILSYMQWIHIYQPALQNVSPSEVFSSYQSHLENNRPKETFSYQIVSVRPRKQTLNLTEEIAKKIQPLMNVVSTEAPHLLVEKIQTTLQEDTSVQVSEAYTVEASQLSNEHNSILSALEKGSFSPPVLQKSRTDDSSVIRIFYLIDHQCEDPIPYEMLQETLQNDLVQRATTEARRYYVAKLKKRYRCDTDEFYQMIPEDYKPFLLQ